MSKTQHVKTVLACLVLFFGLSAQEVAAQAMTCNTALQISVDQNCEKLISADDLLEGDPDPSVTYFIMLKKNNTVVESGPAPLLVDGIAPNGAPYIYLNRTLTAEIFNGDPSTSATNSCWSRLTFEDKLPPVVSGQQTFNVSCLDDLSCIVAPTAIDNCGTVTVNQTDEIISSDLCNGRVIERTYIAFDNNGNVSDPFVVTINISQAPITFPRDIDWTCAQYAAYSSITNATERSACIFDTVDDDNDGVLTSADDDDNDFTTQFDNDDDPITVGLVVGADDDGCIGGENDTANGSGCTAVVCNLTIEAGGTGIECGITQANGLEDDDILATTGSGTPNVYQVGSSDFCSFNVTFEDDTLEICNGVPGVLKIAREWRVLNWCDLSVVTDLQVIKVSDAIDPVVEVPAAINLTANVAGSGHSFCSSSGLLPLPTLTDDCSGINASSVQVSTPVGQAIPFIQNGVVVGYQIPAPFLALGGPYTITYTVSDNCGNQATATTLVSVVDQTPPVAVCDEITSLSLTTTQATAIFASTLNDGSSDECGELYFKILRMDEQSADPRDGVGIPQTCDMANVDDSIEPVNQTFFDDEAFFCCEDIATNLNNVIVRVFDVDPGNGAISPDRFLPTGDLFGRFNDCMVQIEVEDKVAPVKLLDAPDRTFSCTETSIRQQYADPANLTFDAPTFSDNCDFTVSLSIVDGTTNCGDGLIRRRFQATDDFGNLSVLCEQRINFTLEHDYTIQWGNDFEGSTSDQAAVLADTLDDDDIIERDCDLLAISHTDLISTVPNDPCKTKVLRTTEVINWCEWDGVSGPVIIDNPANTLTGPRLDVIVGPNAATNEVRINGALGSLSSVGRWQYTQVFVFDEASADPTVSLVSAENCTDGISVPNPSGIVCGGGIRATFEVTDGCVNTGAAIGYFAVTDFVDANGNGTFETGEGTILTGNNDNFGNLSQIGTTVVVEGTYPLGTIAIVVNSGTSSSATAIISAEQCLGSQPLYNISAVNDCEDLGNLTPPVSLLSIPNPEGLLCGGQVRISGAFTSPCLGSLDYYLVTGVTDTDGDGTISAAELATGVSFENASDTDPNGEFSIAINDIDFRISGTYPLGLNAVVITAVAGTAVTQEIISFEGLDCVRPEARTTTLPLGISISQANGLLLTPQDVDAATPSNPDNGSRDNCGMPVVLEIKRESETDASYSTTGVMLNCSDIITNANNETVVLVEFRVTDQAGNQTEVVLEIPAFCTTPRSIQGRIADLQGQGVQNTRIITSGDYLNSYTTGADGDYLFTDVVEGSQLTLTPINDLQHVNGLTTNDIYYIGQHILGNIPFTFNEQYFAADANMSGTISAYDMTIIRRLILGLESRLPQGVTSWRFFDKSFAPSGTTSPLTQSWPELISYSALDEDVTGADFMAVKVGDVNASARANLRQPLAPRTENNPFILEAENAVLEAGQVYELEFKSGESTTTGYQATLEWDNSKVEVVEVLAATHPISGFGTQVLDQGQLTMSHAGNMDGTLFVLKVKALESEVTLSEAFTISSAITVAEAFNEKGTQEVALRFSNNEIATSSRLEQNVPNPFSGETAIRFNLAKAGVATLSITDVAGRVVYATQSDFAAGQHQIVLNADQLKRDGIYTYTLVSGSFTSSKKLVLIR